MGRMRVTSIELLAAVYAFSVVTRVKPRLWVEGVDKGEEEDFQKNLWLRIHSIHFFTVHVHFFSVSSFEFYYGLFFMMFSSHWNSVYTCIALSFFVCCSSPSIFFAFLALFLFLCN